MKDSSIIPNDVLVEVRNLFAIGTYSEFDFGDAGLFLVFTFSCLIFPIFTKYQVGKYFF